MKVGDRVKAIGGLGLGVKGEVVEIVEIYGAQTSVGVKVASGGVWWFHLAHLKKVGGASKRVALQHKARVGRGERAR